MRETFVCKTHYNISSVNTVQSSAQLVWWSTTCGYRYRYRLRDQGKGCIQANGNFKPELVSTEDSDERITIKLSSAVNGWLLIKPNAE